ncbi:dCTP deaminase [Streptomyces griseoincarnatus]
MILTGDEILRQRELGRIQIEPFDADMANPNSFNYRLGAMLRVHTSKVIDALGEQPLEEIKIPEEGLVLEPGRIYLGTTLEKIGGDTFVPHLIGRSSTGRLGLFLQYSAPLGNIGAAHCWTLEIKVVQPLRVYAGMRVGQVTFWRAEGRVDLYDGYFGRHSEARTAPPTHLS